MENWLKSVEHEFFTKYFPHQTERMGKMFNAFRKQGHLDESLSPEKMAEIIVEFVKVEKERQKVEEERKNKEYARRFEELMDKRIGDIKSTKSERPPKSLDYQLGFIIGDQIVDRYLITLSNERGTRNVIEISSEEQAEYERLHDAWSCNYNSDIITSAEKEWKAYRDYAHFLQKKYLPAKLECHVSRIESVNDIEELKKGIRNSLWNSDVCCYDTTVIDIEDDNIMSFSKVTIYLEKPEV